MKHDEVAAAQEQQLAAAMDDVQEQDRDPVLDAIEDGTLPIFMECCDDQQPTVEETAVGPMDRCKNCGDYI